MPKKSILSINQKRKKKLNSMIFACALAYICIDVYVYIYISAAIVDLTIVDARGGIKRKRNEAARS